MAPALQLRPQEPPITAAVSCNYFQPSQSKPFLSTPAALDAFGIIGILAALRYLQRQALVHKGIDYLQVFETPDGARLWFIEDGPGGAITALLPSDY